MRFTALTLPKNVQHCFHAMSLDERRPSFVNQRVAGAYEVWFRGVHSDIGGGNDNAGLNNVTLRWMFRKAIACGLPVTEANITDANVHPEQRIKPNILSEAEKLFWRDVAPTDWVHYTVAQHHVLPGEPCRDLPADVPIETAEFEKRSRDASGSAQRVVVKHEELETGTGGIGHENTKTRLGRRGRARSKDPERSFESLRSCARSDSTAPIGPRSGPTVEPARVPPVLLSSC